MSSAGLFCEWRRRRKSEGEWEKAPSAKLPQTWVAVMRHSAQIGCAFALVILINGPHTERHNFNFDAISDPFSVWKYLADKDFLISTRFNFAVLMPNASHSNKHSLRFSRTVFQSPIQLNTTCALCIATISAIKPEPQLTKCFHLTWFPKKRNEYGESISSERKHRKKRMHSLNEWQTPTRWHRSTTTSTNNKDDFIATNAP